MGPGDDAALLEPCTSRLFWTTDLQAEGVHFRREWMPLRLAARRALAALNSAPMLPLASTRSRTRAGRPGPSSSTRISSHGPHTRQPARAKPPVSRAASTIAGAPQA